MSLEKAFRITAAGLSIATQQTSIPAYTPDTLQLVDKELSHESPAQLMERTRGFLHETLQISNSPLDDQAGITPRDRAIMALMKTGLTASATRQGLTPEEQTMFDDYSQGTPSAEDTLRFGSTIRTHLTNESNREDLHDLLTAFREPEDGGEEPYNRYVTVSLDDPEQKPGDILRHIAIDMGVPSKTIAEILNVPSVDEVDATTITLPVTGMFLRNNPDFRAEAPAPREFMPIAPPTAPEPPQAQYLVHEGDTMIDIAQKTGVSLQDLLTANPQKASDPNTLVVNETLNVPNQKTIGDELVSVAVGESANMPLPGEEAAPYTQAITDGLAARNISASDLSVTRAADGSILMSATIPGNPADTDPKKREDQKLVLQVNGSGPGGPDTQDILKTIMNLPDGVLFVGGSGAVLTALLAGKLYLEATQRYKEYAKDPHSHNLSTAFEQAYASSGLLELLPTIPAITGAHAAEFLKLMDGLASVKDRNAAQQKVDNSFRHIDPYSRQAVPLYRDGELIGSAFIYKGGRGTRYGEKFDGTMWTMDENGALSQMVVVKQKGVLQDHWTKGKHNARMSRFEAFVPVLRPTPTVQAEAAAEYPHVMAERLAGRAATKPPLSATILFTDAASPRLVVRPQSVGAAAAGDEHANSDEEAAMPELSATHEQWASQLAQAAQLTEEELAQSIDAKIDDLSARSGSGLSGITLADIIPSHASEEEVIRALDSFNIGHDTDRTLALTVLVTLDKLTTGNPAISPLLKEVIRNNPARVADLFIPSVDYDPEFTIAQTSEALVARNHEETRNFLQGAIADILSGAYDDSTANTELLMGLVNEHGLITDDMSYDEALDVVTQRFGPAYTQYLQDFIVTHRLQLSETPAEHIDYREIANQWTNEILDWKTHHYAVETGRFGPGEETGPAVLKDLGAAISMVEPIVDGTLAKIVSPERGSIPIDQRPLSSLLRAAVETAIERRVPGVSLYELSVGLDKLFNQDTITERDIRAFVEQFDPNHILHEVNWTIILQSVLNAPPVTHTFTAQQGVAQLTPDSLWHSFSDPAATIDGLNQFGEVVGRQYISALLHANVSNLQDVVRGLSPDAADSYIEQNIRGILTTLGLTSIVQEHDAFDSANFDGLFLTSDSDELFGIIREVLVSGSMSNEQLEQLVQVLDSQTIHERPDYLKNQGKIIAYEANGDQSEVSTFYDAYSNTLMKAAEAYFDEETTRATINKIVGIRSWYNNFDRRQVPETEARTRYELALGEVQESLNVRWRELGMRPIDLKAATIEVVDAGFEEKVIENARAIPGRNARRDWLAMSTNGAEALATYGTADSTQLGDIANSIMLHEFAGAFELARQMYESEGQNSNYLIEIHNFLHFFSEYLIGDQSEWSTLQDIAISLIEQLPQVGAEAAANQFLDLVAAGIPDEWINGADPGEMGDSLMKATDQKEVAEMGKLEGFRPRPMRVILKGSPIQNAEPIVLGGIPIRPATTVSVPGYPDMAPTVQDIAAPPGGTLADPALGDQGVHIAEATAPATPDWAQAEQVTVESGMTLGAIAAAWDVDVTTLQLYNEITDPTLIGTTDNQVINRPPMDWTPPVAPEPETTVPNSIARLAEMQQQYAETGEITVQPNDTLAQIAIATGTSAAVLMSGLHLTDPRMLQLGTPINADVIAAGSLPVAAPQAEVAQVVVPTPTPVSIEAAPVHPVASIAPAPAAAPAPQPTEIKQTAPVSANETSSVDSASQQPEIAPQPTLTPIVEAPVAPLAPPLGLGDLGLSLNDQQSILAAGGIPSSIVAQGVEAMQAYAQEVLATTDSSTPDPDTSTTVGSAGGGGQSSESNDNSGEEAAAAALVAAAAAAASTGGDSSQQLPPANPTAAATAPVATNGTIYDASLADGPPTGTSRLDDLTRPITVSPEEAAQVAAYLKQQAAFEATVEAARRENEYWKAHHNTIGDYARGLSDELSQLLDNPVVEDAGKIAAVVAAIAAAAASAAAQGGANLAS